MTKLSARLFVEFERRGLRVYSTVHVHVQEWTIPQEMPMAVTGRTRLWPAQRLISFGLIAFGLTWSGTVP
jgi:hypothetical protein